MTSKPRKQLGALLNRVPPATANSQPYGSTAVPYAPEQRNGPQVPPPPPPEPEVPLQVLVPRHAETRKPLRALTLEALRGIGITVTDEDRPYSG